MSMSQPEETRSSGGTGTGGGSGVGQGHVPFSPINPSSSITAGLQTLALTEPPAAVRVLDNAQLLVETLAFLNPRQLITTAAAVRRRRSPSDGTRRSTGKSVWI